MNPEHQDQSGAPPPWSRQSDRAKSSGGKSGGKSGGSSGGGPGKGPGEGPPDRPNWGRFAALFAVVVGVILIARWLYPGEMTTDQTMGLVYFIILVAVIGGTRTLWSRIPMTKAVKYGAMWAGIFVLAVGIGAFWEDLGFDNNGIGARIGRSVLPGVATSTGENGEIIVSRRSDGHFYLAAQVNGARVLFLVDTGATQVALTAEDAERAGIRVSAEDFYQTVNTANGQAKAAPVTIKEITVDDVVVSNVRGHVSQDGLGQSLLGMSFLERFASYEVRGGQLYLRP